MEDREKRLQRQIFKLVNEYIDKYGDMGPKCPAEILASLVSNIGWVGVKHLPETNMEEFVFRMAGALTKTLSNLRKLQEDLDKASGNDESLEGLNNSNSQIIKPSGIIKI